MIIPHDFRRRYFLRHRCRCSHYWCKLFGQGVFKAYFVQKIKLDDKEDNLHSFNLIA